jgi:hypothetical protein
MFPEVKRISAGETSRLRSRIKQVYKADRRAQETSAKMLQSLGDWIDMSLEMGGRALTFNLPSHGRQSLMKDVPGAGAGLRGPAHRIPSWPTVSRSRAKSGTRNAHRLPERRFPVAMVRRETDACFIVREPTGMNTSRLQPAVDSDRERAQPASK